MGNQESCRDRVPEGERDCDSEKQAEYVKIILAFELKLIE